MKSIRLDRLHSWRLIQKSGVKKMPDVTRPRGPRLGRFALFAHIVGACCICPIVHGQVTGQAAAKGEDTTLDEIVITGTLIRGQPPIGGQITSISSADISELGVTDTSQLLSSIPQDANFNNRPQVGNYGQYQTINAPLLRYLGGNSSGSQSTLLLLDGHRLPGMGVYQTSPDIDAIAPGAITRVDTVTDGGSATYGADAVGGVVNLITRNRFDGAEVGGHYGGADAYKQADANAIVGKTWSNGSIWVSYDYSEHSLVYNDERSYVHDLNYTQTPYVGNSEQCNPGNFVAGGYVLTPGIAPGYKLVTTTYPIVNGAPVMGTPNTCDNQGQKAFFPGEQRHSALAGFDFDFSDSINFNVKAYYMHRGSSGDGGALEYAVPASACVYGPEICPAFGNPQTTGTVDANMTPALGDHSPASTSLDTWGITPKLTAKLGHDWELVAFFNYGVGTSTFRTAGNDAGALNSEAASGAFNPFTGLFAPTAAGQAAQNYQANYQDWAQGKDDIVNPRVVLDGPAFALPGGEVRLAGGAEFLHEHYTARSGSGEYNDLDNTTNGVARNIESAFGEMAVPIVGEGNRLPGLYSLTLSAAGRYDHYSDFGSTTNPKFGVSFMPISSLTLRGTWSKSFQAPSLASTAQAIPAGFVTFPAGTFGPNPAYPNTSGQTVLLLYPGGGVGLKPQKATTWELGTDFKPTFLPGFTASLTYYSILFTDRIGTSEFYEPSFYTQYPESYVQNTPAAPLTSAQIAQFVSVATPSSLLAANAAYYIAHPELVYSLDSALNQNLSATETKGLDFSANYNYPTSFGSVFANVGGTYVLSFSSQATAASPFLGLSSNSVPRLRVQTAVGARMGEFLARATWKFTDSFATAASIADAEQSRVASFGTIDLALQYAPNASGLLNHVMVTLNVENVADTRPPAYNGDNGAGYGYADFTLGRLIELGIDKKF